jgi:hypothetical protein
MGQNNVMRWDCEKSGCFNIKHRVKLGMLSSALPRRIGFTDVDGIVEINGKGLLLEWKGKDVPIPTGQHIMFSRLTRGKTLTVFVVEGNAETMEVYSLGYYFDGKKFENTTMNLPGLIESIRGWVKDVQP